MNLGDSASTLGASRKDLASLAGIDSMGATPPEDHQLGTHLLVEMYDCQNLPAQVEDLQSQMEHAAALMGATIVASRFHAFNPQGLSGVVVIVESHLAIHTWPEYQCACVDLFTCSPIMDSNRGIEFLQRAFQAGRVEQVQVARGLEARNNMRPVSNQGD